MAELVVSDGVVTRLLAVVPAIVVALCVRVLTLGAPPTAARLGAAAVVAVACWTAYRLLTVRVRVDGTGVHVRGVFYDARIGFDELQGADQSPASWPVRALVWGLMRPHAVELRTARARLRPLALLSVADDDDVERLVRAIQVRTGAWRTPAQREPADAPATVR